MIFLNYLYYKYSFNVINIKKVLYNKMLQLYCTSRVLNDFKLKKCCIVSSIEIKL